MDSNSAVGKKAEGLAVAWFTEKGFRILHCNWRFSYYEIDIIAEKNEKVHFIEVKFRSNTRFGFPELGVTKKKMRDLMKAADAFLHRHPKYRYIQFDILAINDKGKEKEYFLIEDVYL